MKQSIIISIIVLVFSGCALSPAEGVFTIENGSSGAGTFSWVQSHCIESGADMLVIDAFLELAPGETGNASVPGGDYYILYRYGDNIGLLSTQGLEHLFTVTACQSYRLHVNRHGWSLL
jgi:hypothetical protein